MQTEQTVQETPAVEASKPLQNVTTELRDGQEILVVQPNTRLLTSEEQDELSALSLEVFGASSRWSTLLKKGLVESVTETVTEYIPEEKDEAGNIIVKEETREVAVPVYYRSPKRGETKIPLLRKRTFTVEEVKAYMLKLKAEQERIRALIEKMRAEQEAERKQKELAAKVQEAAGGSAQ